MKIGFFLPKTLILALISTLMAHQALEGFSNYSSLFKSNSFKSSPKSIKSAFLPDLGSHNVLTFYNLSDIAPQDSAIKSSIRDLTLAIHDNYKSINDGTFITINGVAQSPARYFQVTKGIHIPKDSTYITLYSGGFARESRPLRPTEESDDFYKKLLNMLIPGFQVRGLPQKGGGALFSYIEMRENLIHTPCICFDYPDKRETANFAQLGDLVCLNNIFNALPSHVQLLLMGTSRGATAALKSQLDSDAFQAKILVLESPFLNLQETITRLIKTNLYSLPFPSFLIASTFNWFYPSYKVQEDNLDIKLACLPHDAPINSKPIFIAHLFNDSYVPNESMFFIVKSLAKANKNVHFLVLKDPTKKARHGKLSMCKPFQQALNAFYKKYDLPYHEELAQEGQELLEQTAVNAYQENFDTVVITQTSPYNQPVKFKEFELKDK